jgi:hypothetical protein
VRRWLEHELAVSLGLNPPALPITQPSPPHLAACTPEEAAQVLSLIQGMLPVVHVFFELGREGAAPSEGIEAFRLADIMRHTRLEVPDQVLACLEVLDQAVQRVRNDPDATFHAVDERGYCLVAAQTQRSIRTIWQQLVAPRELLRSAVSSHTEGPVSARFAPGPFPGVSSFLTASPSGPAVPLHEMAPSTSSDRLGAGARIDLSGLFPAQGILQTANRILHFANNLLGLAFSFQLLIAEQFSDDFLHGSFGLLCRTFDSILIHSPFSIC